MMIERRHIDPESPGHSGSLPYASLWMRTAIVVAMIVVAGVFAAALLSLGSVPDSIPGNHDVRSTLSN